MDSSGITLLNNDSRTSDLADDFNYTIQLNFTNGIYLTLMVLINLTITLSNTCILAILLKTDHLRNKLTYTFVINLATVDLLASLTIVPLAILRFLVPEILQTTICALLSTMNQCLVSLSIWGACLISIERLYSIAFPMHYSVHMSPVKTAAAILTTWLLSGTISCLPLMLGKYCVTGTPATCGINLDLEIRRKLLIISSVASFILPTSVMVAMYIAILKIARDAARNVQPLPANGQERMANDTHIETSHEIEIQSPHEPMSSIIDTTRNSHTVSIGWNSVSVGNIQKSISPYKALRTLVVLVGLFLLFWLPYHIFYITKGDLTVIPWNDAVVWFGYASFAANPFLYGWMNKIVREEIHSCFRTFRSLFCPCCLPDTTDVEVLDQDQVDQGSVDFYQFLGRNQVPAHPIEDNKDIDIRMKTQSNGKVTHATLTAIHSYKLSVISRNTDPLQDTPATPNAHLSPECK